MKAKRLLGLICGLMLGTAGSGVSNAHAQDGPPRIRVGTWAQLWARTTELNPGSLLAEGGDIQERVTDISLRRWRANLEAQLSTNAMVFLLVGVNNTNFLTDKGVEVTLFDAWIDYKASDAFHFGGGRSPWNGLSRYSSPDPHKSLTMDIAPLAVPTNNLTDDGLRKLGVWVRGLAGGLDYRLTMFKPNSVENPRQPKEGEAAFTDEGLANVGVAGYAAWQFFFKEPNRTPMRPGTYLGAQKVFNIGAGFEVQKDRVESLSNGESVFHDMTLWAVDVFAEIPVGAQEKRMAVTGYAGYFDYDAGPNAWRNMGMNNPACCVDPDAASFNGKGNAYTVVGTGQSVYVQGGFLFPPIGTEGSLGQVQLFFDYQNSEFERLSDRMVAWNAGAHWLLSGFHSRFTINYQSRPIFFNEDGIVSQGDRMHMFVIQYQFWVQ
jgi:hypothetical protein